jgi:hypothetical protein
MPIYYDAEQKGWSTESLTEEEQEELVRIGAASVVTSLGEALYKALQTAMVESEDDETPKH